MALFRVTLSDTKGRQHVKEVYSNNICGARQQALLQMGQIYSGTSHRNQSYSVVIRDIIKVG